MNKETKARKGGLERIRLYGNPGTAAGRTLGGMKSLATHKKNRTGFKTLVHVRTPRKSIPLAELLGVFMGDGHLGEYQMYLVTNSETDLEHAQFVQGLLESIFGLKASARKRKDSKAVIVTLSSKMACVYMHKIGMPYGNKLIMSLQPPEWILSDARYKKAFLRGLIDTDGTVYEDRHFIKRKAYSSTCVAFTSASPVLLTFVEKTWRELGFSPTISGRDVRLRRRNDVLGYATRVGFSNPKHARKIKV